MTPAQPTIPNTSARDADRPLMELRSALELKQHNPGSPYKADAWRWHLEATGLIHQYPTLPSFDVGIPAISRTFAPANKSSIDTFSEEYNHNVQIEFERGRYIGPASYIDTLCEELGIPWEAEKDIPFQSAVPFIGFLWDLERGEVSITSGKQEKYLTAITAWEESTKHTLEEVQKLYGKLLHACLVIPAGRWKANNRDIGWAEAASTMRSMETIEESWKDGGKVAAGTGQQTVSSVCKENPADGPSRGEYGTTQDLLPAINIPNHLQHYVGRPTHLSAEDLARILEVMAGAWADGTLEVYGTGLLTWHAFCDKNGVSEDQRAPASPLLIASLIATLSGAFSGGTIANYVYGIRAWHILHGVPWKMVDPELEALLKAAEKATPPTSKRKKHQPYTKDFMVAIRGQLDLSTPLHAAVYACLTTTFWSAARVGEFTVKNLTSFDANKHVKPSNVTTTTDQNGFETTEFFIPSTKSEPTNGETVSWSRQNGDTDLETAFHNHIDVNSLPNGGHLFAYKVGSGYKPLTKHKFIQILTTAARAAGLEPLQGHGIRIGSTLEYLLRGIPFDVMKAKGRWASDAFLVYLRKHAQILAPYMQADPVRQEEFIRLTMPTTPPLIR
ncbi:unnamed protein product [Cyclocybe aegerita]|uniref:Tyr recombinase domain-containing protein n=1 Tax=Cyclocybe aegerita TaxID=1973307 RepID=A0A8S0X4D8_CYCAE|nr:unnamed protein product [Cyclocybe aegerita]